MHVLINSLVICCFNSGSNGFLLLVAIISSCHLVFGSPLFVSCVQISESFAQLLLPLAAFPAHLQFDDFSRYSAPGSFISYFIARLVTCSRSPLGHVLDTLGSSSSCPESYIPLLQYLVQFSAVSFGSGKSLVYK